jgi:hypothetical protein
VTESMDMAPGIILAVLVVLSGVILPLVGRVLRRRREEREEDETSPPAKPPHDRR